MCSLSSTGLDGMDGGHQAAVVPSLPGGLICCSNCVPSKPEVYEETRSKTNLVPESLLDENCAAGRAWDGLNGKKMVPRSQFRC